MKYSELNSEQALLFQQQILSTMLEIEKTFDLLAKGDRRNVLLVCDRGSMDPFACERLNKTITVDIYSSPINWL